MAAQAHRSGKGAEPGRERPAAGVPKYMRTAAAPETGDTAPTPLSEWVDAYNDRVAKDIGTHAGSTDDIPHLVEAALDEGRLITNPADPRIPPSLRADAHKK